MNSLTAYMLPCKPSLKHINDLFEEKRDLGYLYRVQAELFETISSKTEHGTNLNNAIVCARKSVQLSPNSIEFGWHLAYLLFKVSKDIDGFEQVVQECKKALRIKKPVDPVEERWLGETPQDRIEFVKLQIEDLMERCKLVLEEEIGSSSDFQSKHLNELQTVVRTNDANDHVPIKQGKEENNLHQIPVDCAADDLMAEKGCQAKSKNLMAEKDCQAKSERGILESFGIRMVTDLNSAPEVVDEIRRLCRSMPPRPRPGQIKKANDDIRKIEEKEELLRKAISRPSQEVPDKQIRESLVSYEIQKEKRKARAKLTKLLYLENLQAQFD